MLTFIKHFTTAIFIHTYLLTGVIDKTKLCQQAQAISQAEIMYNVTVVAEKSKDNDKNNQADSFTGEAKNTFKKADGLAGKYKSYTEYSSHQSYVDTVDTRMDNFFSLLFKGLFVSTLTLKMRIINYFHQKKLFRPTMIYK